MKGLEARSKPSSLIGCSSVLILIIAFCIYSYGSEKDLLSKQSISAILFICVALLVLSIIMISIQVKKVALRINDDLVEHYNSSYKCNSTYRWNEIKSYSIGFLFDDSNRKKYFIKIEFEFEFKAFNISEKRTSKEYIIVDGLTKSSTEIIETFRIYARIHNIIENTFPY